MATRTTARPHTSAELAEGRDFDVSSDEDEFTKAWMDAMTQGIEDGPVNMPGMGCVFLVRPPAVAGGTKGVLIIPEEVIKCPKPAGCCTWCEGTGNDYENETNGLCWDCRGTGHTHE